MEDLKNRFWIGSIVILTLGLFLFFSYKVPFAIGLTVIVIGLVALAQWEFYHMAAQKGLHEQSVAYLASPLYIGAIFVSSYYSSWCHAPSIVIGAIIFLLLVQHFYVNKDPIHRISVSLMGIFYVVVPLSFLIKITFVRMGLPLSGQWWVMMLVLVTKTSDMGAYFIGKTIGKHFLAPKVSPKKTYEGLIGGILFSVGTCFAVIYLTPTALKTLSYPWLYAIIIGIALSCIGLLSDLTESLIKRDAGVKDSNKLKGFGGILDMLDSLIFAAPAFYLFLVCGHFV